MMTSPLITSMPVRSPARWANASHGAAADYGTRTVPAPVPAPMSYDHPDTSGWYSYDVPTAAYAQQQYSYGAIYQAPPQYPPYEEFCQAPATPSYTQKTPRGSKAHRPPYNNFLSTEKRKIIIRGIPSSTAYAEVWDLVRSKAGSEADGVLHVSLPTASAAPERGSNRGYATVTFRSEEVALKVIRRLNGHKFGSRSLTAEFTKEGVSRNEGSSSSKAVKLSSAAPRTSGNGGHHEKRPKLEKPKAERKESIVIANGSSR